MKPDIVGLILWFVVFLFSLAFHESAHAWTSNKFGDSTGRYLGRITLNPIPHIDLWGTVIFPIAGHLTGGIMFGWAKPVPVNPYLWRQKVKANILTSAAGPASNILLATSGLILAKILIAQGVLTGGFGGWEYAVIPAARNSFFLSLAARLLCITIFLNISLGVFNLVPVPPLDGSHILQAVLPYEQAAAYEQIRPYGVILLVG
ncbi:MAG TPA: site-2 protease family protein, partial [Blastocatellia bacterium]|nr:site-2 protease family protein [Blastocatellia bacterium]